MVDWTDCYEELSKSQDKCTHAKPGGFAGSAVIWHQTIGGASMGLCTQCTREFKPEDKLSQASTWQESGINGGSGFYHRESVYDEWKFQSWKAIPAKSQPGNRLAAIQLIDKWGGLYGKQYALVQCSECHIFHPSTGKDGWVGHTCDSCSPEKKKMGDPIIKPGGQKAVFDYMTGQPIKGAAVANVTEYQKKKVLKVGELNVTLAKAEKVEQKGTVRKLPKVNSPMWTDQWSVTGSGKQPYIISHKTNGGNGSTTEDGWACSCPAFTRNVPREDCKHILKVRLSEGIGANAKPVTAAIPAGQQAAFAKFLKAEAAKKRAETVDAPGAVKMVGDSTGRKFR